jgi:hypothetical protein
MYRSFDGSEWVHHGGGTHWSLVGIDAVKDTSFMSDNLIHLDFPTMINRSSGGPGGLPSWVINIVQPKPPQRFSW